MYGSRHVPGSATNLHARALMQPRTCMRVPALARHIDVHSMTHVPSCASYSCRVLQPVRHAALPVQPEAGVLSLTSPGSASVGVYFNPGARRLYLPCTSMYHHSVCYECSEAHTQRCALCPPSLSVPIACFSPSP